MMSDMVRDIQQARTCSNKYHYILARWKYASLRDAVKINELRNQTKHKGYFFHIQFTLMFRPSQHRPHGRLVLHAWWERFLHVSCHWMHTCATPTEEGGVNSHIKSAADTLKDIQLKSNLWSRPSNMYDNIYCKARGFFSDLLCNKKYIVFYYAFI